MMNSFTKLTEEDVMRAEKYLSVLEAIAETKVYLVSQEDVDRVQEYANTLEWVS